jgi:hypothetical protein
MQHGAAGEPAVRALEEEHQFHEVYEMRGPIPPVVRELIAEDSLA